MPGRIMWLTLIAAVVLVQPLAVAAAPVLRVSEVVAPAQRDTLTVPVLLEATPGHNIAGLQFELEFDADALSLPPKSAVKTGSESARAEKQVSYSLIAPGKARVLVVGFNRNTLAGGEIVSIEFSLRRDRVELFEPVRVKNAVLSDLAGRKIPETSEDGGIRFSVAAVESNPNPASDVSKKTYLLAGCAIMTLCAAVAISLRLRSSIPLPSPSVGSAKRKR